MDAANYKRICAQADVLPRGVVEATHRLVSQVDAVLAAKVRRILAVEPVPKPPRHLAGAHSDYLPIGVLPHREIEAVVEALGELEAAAVASGNVRLTDVGGLLDAWNRAMAGGSN